MSHDTESARKQTRADFAEAVNMAPQELEDWLKTDESRAVGDSPDGGESTGHKSGRRIVEIKRKTVDELTEDDHDWMRKVVGYVNRHTAQGGPEQDRETSRWRYSLMNWGHDPLK